MFALGCGGDPATNPPPAPEDPGPATGSVCPTDQTLTYENFGMAFFADYCTHCHSTNPPDGTRYGAPRGLDWDVLETVRAHADQIDKMAAAGPDATNTIMPPRNPRPNDDQRRQLGEWLECGAP